MIGGKIELAPLFWVLICVYRLIDDWWSLIFDVDWWLLIDDWWTDDQWPDIMLIDAWWLMMADDLSIWMIDDIWLNWWT
jgi:hypothetical protein